MARLKFQFAIKKKYGSQRKFAEAIGKNEKQISQVARGGSISQDMAVFLADHLGKSPEFLFGREYKQGE